MYQALLCQRNRMMTMPMLRRQFASVTAAMVKELRDKTGSPMMDCKKALSDPEVNGDMELAVDWLRKRGVAIAAKKADRVSNEGLVGVQINEAGNAASIVEVNSETDFVARNDVFQQAVVSIGLANMSNSKNSCGIQNVAVEELQNIKVDGETVSDMLIRCTATVGESLKLKRAFNVKGDIIGTYVHNVRGKGCGTQAAVVALRLENPLGDTEPVQKLANALAMHVVGAQPKFLSQIPEDFKNRERELENERLMNELQAEKKDIDPEVAQKRVEKKVEKILKKLTAESVLLNQEFLGLPSPLAPNAKDIKSMLATAGKAVGSPIAIDAAIHVVVGLDDHVAMTP